MHTLKMARREKYSLDDDDNPPVAVKEKPKLAPVQEEKPLPVRWNWVMAFNVVAGIIGNIGFGLIPLVFVIGKNRFKPEIWMIFYTIIFGIDFLFYLGLFIALSFAYKNSDMEEIRRWLGRGATWYSYKRMTGYFIIKSFVFIALVGSWWGWMSANHYLSPGTVPYAPVISDNSYDTFFYLCVVHMFLTMVWLTYALVFTREVWRSRYAKTIEVENNGSAIDVPRRTENLTPNKGTYVYWVSSAIQYAAGFVLFLIMFILTFNVDIKFNINAFFALWVIITVMYIVSWLSYYIGSSDMRSIIVKQAYGSIVDDVMYASHIMWGFIIGFDIVMLGSFFALRDSDDMNFHSYPHFQPFPNLGSPPYYQKQSWYQWQAVVLMNATMLVFWAMYLTTLIFISARTPKETTERLEKTIKEGKVNEDALPAFTIFRIGIYWVMVLIVFTFMISAVVGNNWFLTAYKTYAIIFSVLSAVVIGIIIFGHKYNSSFMSDEEVYLNGEWMLSTWRLAVVLPIYWAMAFITLWLSYSKYHTYLGGIDITAANTITELPTSTPVPAFTFYWPNIVTMQALLSIVLVILLVDMNATATVKSLQFKAKKRVKPSKSDTEGN